MGWRNVHGCRTPSIPVNTILAISALLVAVMFVVAASSRSLASAARCAPRCCSVLPWLLAACTRGFQRFQVVPNEQGARVRSSFSLQY